MQHIILYVIIACAAAYLAYRIADALLHPADVCSGCKGCEVNKELLKNYNGKRGRPSCYDKK